MSAHAVPFLSDHSVSGATAEVVHARDVDASANSSFPDRPRTDVCDEPTSGDRASGQDGVEVADDAHATLRRVQHALEDIRDLLRIGLRSLSPAPVPAVAGPGVALGDRPISSWQEVARAVGVDDSTIRAHRRRTRDPKRPYFANDAEARTWYAQLVAAPDFAETRSRRRGPNVRGGVVDFAKIKL